VSAEPIGLQATPQLRELDALLEAFSSALLNSMNPHRVALRHLGVDAMGHVSTPYHDEAWKVWSAQLGRGADEVETLHHLALMHHARAIDLEAGPSPARSDDDWKSSLRYWHRLWLEDGFWDGLAALACKDGRRAPVDGLRAEFPALLLQVHFDIALHPKTKEPRSKFHVRAALDSDFPAEAKDKARGAAYAIVVADLPPNIWRGEKDPAVIQKGAEQIEKYLKKDAGYLPAVEDGLRLQMRLLENYYDDLMGMGARMDAEGRLLISRLRGLAGQWGGYFEPLCQMVERLDDDIRSKLYYWHLNMGDIYHVNRERTSAISFYLKAKKACQDDDEKLQICEKRLRDARGF